MLLLLRLTGRKRRPGPTSTRWIVALAKRTVAPGERGRWRGEPGWESGGGEGDKGVRMGEEGGRPGLVGSPVSGLSMVRRGLKPSGLATRRMDLGIGTGDPGGLGMGMSVYQSGHDVTWFYLGWYGACEARLCAVFLLAFSKEVVLLPVLEVPAAAFGS